MMKPMHTRTFTTDFYNFGVNVYACHRMSPDSDYLSPLLEDDISNVLDGVIEGCDVFEFG